jgi:hypothetical protein
MISKSPTTSPSLISPREPRGSRRSNPLTKEDLIADAKTVKEYRVCAQAVRTAPTPQNTARAGMTGYARRGLIAEGGRFKSAR